MHKYKTNDVVIDRHQGRVVITKLCDGGKLDSPLAYWYDICTEDGRNISTFEEYIERLDIVATLKYKKGLIRGKIGQKN